MMGLLISFALSGQSSLLPLHLTGLGYFALPVCSQLCVCNYWLAAVAFQEDSVEWFKTINDSKLLISKFYLIIDLNGMVNHFFSLCLGTPSCPAHSIIASNQCLTITIKGIDTLKGKWLKKLLLLMWQFSQPHRAYPLCGSSASVLPLIAFGEPNTSLWGVKSSFLGVACRLNWCSGLSMPNQATWMHEESQSCRLLSVDLKSFFFWNISHDKKKTSKERYNVGEMSAFREICPFYSGFQRHLQVF